MDQEIKRSNSADRKVNFLNSYCIYLSWIFLFSSCLGSGESLIKQASHNLKSNGRQEMAYIPEGNFIMGDPAEKKEKKLWVKAFYLDIFEITNSQFKKFVEENNIKRPLPRYWINKTDYLRIFRLDNNPVVDVDWFMARSYCEWKGKRLPTEEEWEKAARGTDGRKWPWGNNFDPARANILEAKLAGTLPVGSFPQGVSPYGIYDLAGNVWEWTDTFYDFSEQEKTGEKYMVIRGGSYAAGLYPYGLTYYRYYYPQSHYQPGITNSMADLDIGFRCAKDAPGLNSKS